MFHFATFVWCYSLKKITSALNNFSDFISPSIRSFFGFFGCFFVVCCFYCCSLQAICFPTYENAHFYINNNHYLDNNFHSYFFAYLETPKQNMPTFHCISDCLHFGYCQCKITLDNGNSITLFFPKSYVYLVSVNYLNEQMLVNCSGVLKNNLFLITRRESSAKKKREETEFYLALYYVSDLSYRFSHFNLTNLKIRFVIPLRWRSLSQFTQLCSDSEDLAPPPHLELYPTSTNQICR